jgi:hypothetical protein
LKAVEETKMGGIWMLSGAAALIALLAAAPGAAQTPENPPHAAQPPAAKRPMSPAEVAALVNSASLGLSQASEFHGLGVVDALDLSAQNAAGAAAAATIAPSTQLLSEQRGRLRALPPKTHLETTVPPIPEREVHNAPLRDFDTPHEPAEHYRMQHD